VQNWRKLRAGGRFSARAIAPARNRNLPQVSAIINRRTGANKQEVEEMMSTDACAESDIGARTQKLSRRICIRARYLLS
jgi:hypothetical protein